MNTFDFTNTHDFMEMISKLEINIEEIELYLQDDNCCTGPDLYFTINKLIKFQYIDKGEYGDGKLWPQDIYEASIWFIPLLLNFIGMTTTFKKLTLSFCKYWPFYDLFKTTNFLYKFDIYVSNCPESFNGEDFPLTQESTYSDYFNLEQINLYLYCHGEFIKYYDNFWYSSKESKTVSLYEICTDECEYYCRECFILN